MRLRGKVALVTGAGAGIGRAAARGEEAPSAASIVTDGRGRVLATLPGVPAVSKLRRIAAEANGG